MAKEPGARLWAWVKLKEGRNARISLYKDLVFVDLSCYDIDSGHKHANAEGPTLARAVDNVFEVWKIMYERKGR